LFVVAWPGGLPRLWTVVRRSKVWQVSSEPVPGDWFKSDWPYGAAAISPRGDLYVLESNQRYWDAPPRGGELRLSVRDRRSWRWTSSIKTTDYRYAYAWLLPDAVHKLAVVATRDVPWSMLGYRQPIGTKDWAMNSVRAWRTGDALEGLGPSSLVREETPTARYPNAYVSAAQPDVYRDSAGRLHVFYSFVGPSSRGIFGLRHAVLVGGRVVADVALPSTLDFAKIVEDSHGQLVVFGTKVGSDRLYVYRAASADGTRLDEPTTASLRGHGLEYAGFTVADPRSGTPRSDRVDVVYPSGRRRQVWVHFTLRLR
jgi:hypothetical protein